MTSPDSHAGDCPIDRLDQILAGQPDQPIPEDLCQHLDQCATCRIRLEARAGSEIDWKRVREALNLGLHSPEKAPAKVDPTVALLKLLNPSDNSSFMGRIGQFEVMEVIGSGGMGLVLKAKDPALHRFVAVKILAPHLAASASARRRFGREARAAAAVIHDNVIAIYQVSEHQELPYLVMPFLPDPSLQQRLDLQGKLDLESALSIALQVANGLQAAHSQGLIHRDIKPANVLLAKGTERAIITDFGLARAADDASLTRSGTLAGTPHYMSPEQARGETVDARSDLFSLGSLFYAMLAGHPPIYQELASETIRAIATEPMPRLKSQAPDAPEWVDRLVGWLHQSAPENRPQSAQEIAGVLEQCLIHLRQPESHPLPERLTAAEDTTMANPKDKRLFSLIALFLFLGTLLSPALIALTTRDEYALAFGILCGTLTLAFAYLSWGESISRGVVKTLGGLVVVGGLALAGLFAYSEFGGGDRWKRALEAERAAMTANLAKQNETAGKDKGNLETDQKNTAKGLTLKEELKQVLGEDKAISEWKKPVEAAIPQLAGTWLATKAVINGKEVPVADAEQITDQRIWLVSHENYLYLTQGSNPDYDPYKRMILGSGFPELFYQNNDQTGRFFRIPFHFQGLGQIRKSVLENADRGIRSVNTAMREISEGKQFNSIYSRYEIKDKTLRIAFAEKKPRLESAPEQNYFELKQVSERVPESLPNFLERDLVSLPFRSIQGEYSKTLVSEIIGTWKIDQAMFQGVDFIAKKRFENLVLISDGKGLMIMDSLSTGASLFKRPVLGMGIMDSWEPVRSGSFKLLVSTPTPIFSLSFNPGRSAQTQPWAGHFFIENNQLNLSFSGIFPESENRQPGVSLRNDLVAHRIPDDPILKLVKSGSQDRFDMGIFDLIEGSPFPFTQDPEDHNFFWDPNKPCQLPTLGELNMGKQSRKYSLGLFGTNFPAPRFPSRAFEKGDLARAVILATPDQVTQKNLQAKLEEIKLNPIIHSLGGNNRPDGLAFVEVWFPESSTREQALAVKEKILASGLPLDRLVVHFSSKVSDELIEPIRPKKTENGTGLEKEKDQPPKPDLGKNDKSAKESGLLSENLKRVLGEDQPPPAWKKNKAPVLPQLVGTWLATKAFVNGKEIPVADAQNQANQRVWLVAYGDYLYLTQAALPDYDPDKTTFLGAGKPYPFYGNNAQSGWFFEMHIFDDVKIREERKKRAEGTPGISPGFPVQKRYNFIYSRFEFQDGTLRIAFSEKTPELERAPSQQYFEFKRVSENVPLSLHAMREQDLITVPFQAIQGDYSPAIVPGVAGTWKVDAARFQGKDFLATQSLENLLLISNGSELMLLDAPTKKPDSRPSRLVSLGRLGSWDPVSKGSFQLHTQAIRLSSEGTPLGFKDLELATGKAIIQGDKLEILFSPTLAGEQNRENYLVAHQIPNDPVLNLNLPLKDNFKLHPFPFSKRPKLKSYFWNLDNTLSYPSLKDIVDIQKLSQAEKLSLFGTPFPEPNKKPVVSKETKYFTLEVLSGIPPRPQQDVAEILDQLEDCGILCKYISYLGRSEANQGFIVTIHFGDTASQDQAKEIRSKIEPFTSRFKNLTVHFISDIPGKPGKILESIEPKTVSPDKDKLEKEK